MATAKSPARISDEAVRAKTRKRWSEWFRLLDEAGAAKLSHREIVAVLAREKVSGWWAQSITVTYEQARGLREKHEVAGGFSVSRSRTLKAPIDVLFEAWRNAARRRRWLGVAGLTLRKATPNKSIRITWPDETHVEVLFHAKGHDKTQMVVTHSMLKDAAAGEAQKAFWTAKIERLEALTRASE